MKLTNYLRDAFITAALQDVPSVDYIEQIRNLLNEFRLSILKPLKLDKAEAARLNETYLYFCHQSFQLKGCTYVEAKQIEVNPTLKELAAKFKDQNLARDVLKEKLRGIAYGCTSDKQLIGLLPEFAKYLPPPEVKTNNLPAISNVVGDFIRAGWPKDNQKVAA